MQLVSRYLAVVVLGGPLAIGPLVPAVRAAAASRQAALLEQGWFSRARQLAATAAERTEIAAAIAAVDAANGERSAAVANTSRWQVAWNRSGAVAGPVAVDRCVAGLSSGGIDLFAVDTGRRVWGAGPDGGGPLFPRLPPPLRQSLPGPGAAGSIAVAAGRLFGLIDPPMPGRGGLLLVAIDLAPAAEGRVAWTKRLAPGTLAAPAGLAATADSCFVATVDPAGQGVGLLAVAAADGGVRWQQSWSLPVPDQRADPVIVTPLQHLVTVAPGGGMLVGVEAASGRRQWQSRLPAVAADSSPADRTDAVAATADRLVVIRRPAGRPGPPKLMLVDPLDGRPAGGWLQPAVDAAGLDFGPPVVRWATVVWPVLGDAARPPPTVLIADLPPAAASPSEAATFTARLVPVVDRPAAAPAARPRGPRLVVRAQERFWGLEPGTVAPAPAVESEGP